MLHVMVNAYVEPMNDCHKPRADGWMMHVLFEPKTDVECVLFE